MEAENKLTGNELVAVPLVVVNDVLAFLQKKPYDEVAKLINDIHTKSRMVTEMPSPAQEPVPVPEADDVVEQPVKPDRKKKSDVA